MSRPITPGKQTSFASATDALAASTAGLNVRAKVAEKPVTEEELMTFLFPPDQQYPASASRLFLFGRYGPLVHGQIVGGSFKRHRGLTKQELGDLITQDEREELLALFLDPSVQKSLTPAEQAQVLGETIAIPHVQHALFNYSTHEVRAFLRHLRLVNGLPEGADIPFGVLATAIHHEHDYRVEQLRAHGDPLPKTKRGTPLQRGLLSKKIGMAPPHGRPVAARVLRVANVPLQTDEANLKALCERYGVCEGLVIPSDGGGKVASPPTPRPPHLRPHPTTTVTTTRSDDSTAPLRLTSAAPALPRQVGSVYKVTMKSAADADAVIKALDGLRLYGHKLSVKHELLAGQAGRPAHPLPRAP